MPAARTAVLLLLSAVLPACLEGDRPPEIGTVTREVNVPVAWQNGSGVAFTGASQNGLSKTGTTTGWNAGASSKQSIGRRGFVRFGTGESTKAKMLGLSRKNEPWGDDDWSDADIDYAIRLENGVASVWVEGTQQGQGVSYAQDDVFYIKTVAPTATADQKIEYWKGLPGGQSSTLIGTTTIPQTQLEDGFFPLEVDTSLKDTGATLGNVVIRPTIHLGVQNDLFDPEYALGCAVGDTIVLNGSHFDEPGDCVTDYSTFAAKDPNEIADHLVSFAGNHGLDLDRSDRIIVMDIERPGAIEIGEERNCTNKPDPHTSTQRAQIIQGIKRRIVGTRKAFPNAQIALYPSLAPHAQANWDAGGMFDLQVQGLQEAVSADMFADIPWDPLWGDPPPICDQPGGLDFCPGLDYFLAVLYTRFGCDVDPTNCDQPWGATKVAAYTNQAITASTDYVITGLPLLPFFSFWVANSTPFNGRVILDLGVGWETALDETLRVSMPLLQDAGVQDVVLWKGGYPDNIVRDNLQDETPQEDNEMCWNASHTDVAICGPGYPNHVIVDDYTCWI
jgi:hypothetical protein